MSPPLLVADPAPTVEIPLSQPPPRLALGYGGTSRSGDGPLRGARFRSAPAVRPRPASGLVKGQRGHPAGNGRRGYTSAAGWAAAARARSPGPPPHLPPRRRAQGAAPGAGDHPRDAGRFGREAELLSRLSHPNVVDVLDRGPQDSLLWIAMQFVAGPDATVLLEAYGADAAGAGAGDRRCGRGGPRPRPRVRPPAPRRQAGEHPPREPPRRRGTGDAHRLRHRSGHGCVVGADPGGRGRGFVRLRRSRAVDRWSARRTRRRVLARCRALRTADRTPGFRRPSLPALLYTVVNAPPPDIRAVRPDFPPALSAVLARALAKDPAHRFRSCAELVSAARACWPVRPPASETAVGQQVPPSPPESPASDRPPPRRGRLLAGIGAGLAVVLAVAVLLVLAPWRTDPNAGPGPTSSTTSFTSSTSTEQPDGTPATGATCSSSSTTSRACCPPPRTAKDGTGPPAPRRLSPTTCMPTWASPASTRTASPPRWRTTPTSRPATRDEANSKGPTRATPPRGGVPTAPRALVSVSSARTSPDFVWQWIMFNQQDKALYVVVLEWSGHTQAELDEEWFARAPFAGPAGT